MIQYRDGIVPVIRLTRLLDERAGEEPWCASVPAVMFEHDGHTLAIAVSAIVDIATEVAEVQPVRGREGIAGAVVLQGRVADLLEIDTVLNSAIAESDLADRRAA